MSKEIFHYCFEIPETDMSFQTISDVVLNEKIVKLNLLKKNIDVYYDANRKYNLWNCMSRDLHPYESIIQKYNINSISRAFYKLFEILFSFDIKIPTEPQGCKTLHLCEAPGGFIQTCLFLYNGKINDFTTISIDSSIKYHKDIRNNRNINILIDDISNAETYDWILERTPEKGFEFITADGAFDVSDNYEKQEMYTYDLLFNEIAVSVSTQKRGGTFIIKLFDSINLKTWSLILWLKSCYKQVYICKPPSSRPVNSEKYCVCLDFVEHRHFCPWIILDDSRKLMNFRNFFLSSTLDLQIEKLEQVFHHIKIKEKSSESQESTELSNSLLKERLDICKNGENLYHNIYGQKLITFSKF